MNDKITYRHIFDSTSNGVIVTDKNGIVTLINERASKILTVKEEELIGHNISQVFPAAGLYINDCISTCKDKLNFFIQDKHLNLVLNTTLIKENKMIIGTVTNFQELQNFETAARQLECYKQLNKQLETIFLSSVDGFWICDNQAKVLKINKASERFYGVKNEEIAGRYIHDLIKSEFFDRSATLEVLDTKMQVSLMQYVKKTNKHLLVTATPAFDENGNISLVLVNERDFTQLDAIQKKLKKNQMVTEKYKTELAELSMRELKQQKLIAESEKIRHVLELSLRLSKMSVSNILLLGESGTGKGLLAKYIHDSGKRKKKSFIQVNCAALPENLLEAELFGYEKGAFTGASEMGKIGLFELADEGTLFLDEIGDLPQTVQAKLLKYLDDQEVMRLGSIKSKKVDCTIIAATNRDLEQRVKQGKFRNDLFYRLNAFTIKIPPLRERYEDIFELIQYYLKKFNKQYSQNKRISVKIIGKLQSYPFYGNVRELKNLIKMAVVVCEDSYIDDIILKNLTNLKDYHQNNRKLNKLPNNLKKEISILEKSILKMALQHLRTTREIADQLNINQSTVVRKLKKYKLI
ncbi:MAG: sigma 54-interacting transcriptional regulator [Desulfobacterales bacterium]|nr:sigma 54-interacting transcriptional regulator [Desulfobacterales bacterium]